MAASGELVGLHDEDMPNSMAELNAYLATVEGLCVTPAAREGLRLVLSPPAPLPGRLAWIVPAAAAVAILPPEVRELYGLPWFEPAEPIVRLATAALCKTMKLIGPRSPTVRSALARARAASEPSAA